MMILVVLVLCMWWVCCVCADVIVVGVGVAAGDVVVRVVGIVCVYYVGVVEWCRDGVGDVVADMMVDIGIAVVGVGGVGVSGDICGGCVGVTMVVQARHQCM